MLRFGKKQRHEKQTSPFPVWILGKDHAQPGDRHVQAVSAKLAGGISAGNKRCVRHKDEGNEDALGAVAFEEGTVLLLADSHFGRHSAEQALQGFGTTFENHQGPVAERLFKTVLDLDRQVRETKASLSPPVAPTCATTLICVWLDGSEMVWCSIGDSSLWHIRRGKAKLENDKTQNFLGDFQPLAEPLRQQLDAWGWVDPTLDHAALAKWYWRISNLNRAVRGLDRDRVSVAQAKSDLMALMPRHATVNEAQLLEPWQPVHLLAPAILPEWGHRTLEPGDRVFLASDGVDEPVSLSTIEDLLALVADSGLSPEATVVKVIDRCHGRRGGDDNLCCWVWDA